MSKLFKLIVIIGSITLIIQSCIYEFTPKTEALGNLLVIYGMVTNENGPHEITILKTKTINSKVNETVSGAKVSIIDDKGNTVPLAEDSVGKYHTPETFAGQIGARYKLNIELQGKQYESDYVELLDVPDISELEAEKITKPATGTSRGIKWLSILYLPPNLVLVNKNILSGMFLKIGNIGYHLLFLPIGMVQYYIKLIPLP